MGTEVLRPQNILSERFREPPVFHRRRNGNGYYGNRKPIVRTEKKKLNHRNQNQSEPLVTPAGKVTPADDRLAMGQVMILRRGESLDSLNPKIRKENKTVSCKQNNISGTEMSPKQIRVGFSPADMYAGSAASNSPSPRALPLPSFFNNSKKQVEFKSFDDSATRDLRRLLRLE